MKLSAIVIRPLFLISAIAFMILCAYTLLQSRRDIAAHAALTADNINNLISQNVSTSIENFDLSLEGVNESLAQLRRDVVPTNLQQLILFDKATTAAYFNDIFITDENGNIIRHSNSAGSIKISVAGNGLFIGKPFNNPLSHWTWAIPLSRRIDKDDGSFGGIVFGSLNLAYFITVFNSVELGDNSAVTILSTDGTLIARHPFQVEDIGLDMSKSAVIRSFQTAKKGTVAVNGVIDGVSRLYSYRQIANLPLIVSVGLSTDSIINAWWERIFVVVTLVLFIGAMLLIALYMLRQQFLSRQKAEHALKRSEERYRVLSENSSDAMLLRALDGTRLFATSALARLTGYTLEELAVRKLEDCVPPDFSPASKSTARQIADGATLVKNEFPFQRADRTWIWIESISNPSRDQFGQISGIITTLRDITDRKRHEFELESSAKTMSAFAMIDGLTNIGNRRSFDLALEREWQSASDHGHDLCIAMIDVDQFKKYNDRFGHQTGDEALKKVAATITRCLRRPSDFGARYGGEEFAVILPMTEEGGALTVLENIRASIHGQAIAHPEGIDARITVSIGLAVFNPGRFPHPADFIAAADKALYGAKNSGRNRVEIFHPGAQAERARVA